MSISIERLKALYTQANPDGHWFDKDTMRWFRCRLPKLAYRVKGGWAFVTSEQNHSMCGQSYPRLYSLRTMSDQGEMDTIGAFNSMTRSEAQTALRQYVKNFPDN